MNASRTETRLDDGISSTPSRQEGGRSLLDERWWSCNEAYSRMARRRTERLFWLLQRAFCTEYTISTAARRVPLCLHIVPRCLGAILSMAFHVASGISPYSNA